MKLMMAAPSPFVRKVRVLVREAGMEDEVDEIEVTASPAGPSDDLIAANPLGKIPALVREYGPTLYDSRVVFWKSSPNATRPNWWKPTGPTSKNMLPG